MTGPIAFFCAPVSIKRGANLHEFTSDSSKKDGLMPDKSVKFVLHGRFKGTQDNRGKRCFNRDCRNEGYACCRYCTTLPYESLKLINNAYTKSLIRFQFALDLWRARRGALDTKLRLLIEELQEFAEVDPLLRKLNVKNSHAPRSISKFDENTMLTRTKKITAGKGRFVKMRAKFWSAQAN